MKQIISLFSFVFLALFTFSCNPKNDSESVLELSATQVEVEKDATEIKIDVNASHPWSYTLPEQLTWLSLKEENDQLILSFTENTTENVRTAVVLLRSNNALERLVVKQKGSVAEFTLETPELTFTSLGEEKNINLGAKGKNVRIEKLDDEAQWLTLRQISNSVYSLRVEPQPEVGSQLRETKIIVTIGNAISKEIKIIQEAQKYYMLPLVKPQLSVQGMFSEEHQRGSQEIRLPGGNNLRFYQFSANARVGNPGFIEYDYSFVEDEVYFKSSVIYKGRDRFEGSQQGLHPDFVKFMQSEGFTRIDRDVISEKLSQRVPSAAIAFFEKTIAPLHFVAFVTRINEEGNDTRIDIVHEPTTDKPKNIDEKQGFTSLPLADKLDWLGSKAFSKPAKKKKDDVHSYEQNLGNTYNEGNSGKNATSTEGVFFSSFDVKPTATAPEFVRGYLTLLPGKYWVQGVNITLKEDDPAIGDVEGILALYDDLGLLFSNYEENIDHRTIKESVKKIFKDNGYPYFKRFAAGEDYFFNPKTKIAFIFDPQKDARKNKMVLRLRVIHANF